MEVSTTDVVAIAAALVSVVSAYYSYRQAGIAKKSIQQQNELRLFQEFSALSRCVIDFPGVFHLVHCSAEEKLSDDEIRALAYYCAIIDGYQLFFNQKYDGDYSKMESELKSETSFFTNVLRAESSIRWLSLVEKIYYGSYDKDYISSIKRVIDHYSTKKCA